RWLAPLGLDARRGDTARGHRPRPRPGTAPAGRAASLGESLLSGLCVHVEPVYAECVATERVGTESVGTERGGRREVLRLPGCFIQHLVMHVVARAVAHGP